MQRSFDDLGTPLHQVTFCVVDLETTGGSPASCEITEVGAARFRGGECLGTFQTLVDPGAPVAPTVSALTGITDGMLRTAPAAAAVVPSLAEFVGGSVLVGHNLRFDVSFLDAALAANDHGPVGLHTVDTVALARRLLQDEVPDCRLGTLAEHLSLPHRPTHRALDDVLATADLLHLLLERAAAFGVSVLDDLLQLPRLARHPHAGKLRLTNRIPRAPGVYVLRDGQGVALHVGRADDDLRRCVRSLFSGDDPRLTGPLLREVQAIEHLVCPSPLAAAVAEIRLVQALEPRRSRDVADWSRYRYVRLAPGPRSRLSVARATGAHTARHLGPLPSAAAARAVIGAVETAVADGPDDTLLTGGGLAVADLFHDPSAVLARLERRRGDAVATRCYARATAIGAMADSVGDAVRRQRAFDALRRVDRAVLATDHGTVELARGRLVGPGDGDTGAVTARAGRTSPGLGPGVVWGAVDLPPDDGPLPPAMADELACVAAWIERHAHRLRPLHVDGVLASAWPRPHTPACADPVT